MANASAHIELDLTIAAKGGDTIATSSVVVPLRVTASHVGDHLVLDADTADIARRIETGLEAFQAAVR